MRETPLEATGKYAYGIDYPCAKEEAIEVMARNGAPADVIDLLRAAPYDRFTVPSEIHSALWLESGGGRFRGDVTAPSPWPRRGTRSV